MFLVPPQDRSELMPLIVQSNTVMPYYVCYLPYQQLSTLSVLKPITIATTQGGKVEAF